MTWYDTKGFEILFLTDREELMKSGTQENRNPCEQKLLLTETEVDSN